MKINKCWLAVLFVLDGLEVAANLVVALLCGLGVQRLTGDKWLGIGVTLALLNVFYYLRRIEGKSG